MNLKSKKTAFGVFSLSFTTLFTSVALGPPLAGLKPLRAGVLTGTERDDAKASIDLFFLTLYKKGLAGGTTGICLDFDQSSGKNNIDIGFDTEAFETGKSVFKKEGNFDPARLKNLVSTLAKTQGGRVQAQVTGYADGQHFYSGGQDPKADETNGFPLSIKNNEKLAQDRADVVLKLLLADPNISKSSPAIGYASPGLETLKENKKIQNCPTRRKVVISVPIQKPELSFDKKGSWNLGPKSFTDKMDIETRTAARGAVTKTLQTSLTKGSSLAEFQGSNGRFKEKYFPAEKIDGHWTPKASPESKKIVEQIYQDMRAQRNPQLLSDACDAYPMKQLTLAYIHSVVDPYNFSGPGAYELLERPRGETYLPLYLNEKDTPAGKTPIKLSLDPSGMPTSVYSCFLPDISLLKSYFAADSGNLISGEQKVTLDSNYKDMKASSPIDIGFTPADLTQIETKSGELKRGYFCAVCGYGFFFEPVANASSKESQVGQEAQEGNEVHTIFHATHWDRTVDNKSEAGKQSQKVFDEAQKQVTDANPLSIAGFQRPSVLIVKNCKNCDCDPLSQVQKGQSANITMIDPLYAKDQEAFQSRVSKAELSESCILRMPMWHTCSVKKTQSNYNLAQEFDSSFRFVDPNTATDFTEGTIDELKDIIDRKVTCDFPGNSLEFGTIQEKIDSVACSRNQKKLPTKDEVKDCAQNSAT
jgi:hypothetical protein